MEAIHLTHEQRLVIVLSRITFNAENVAEVTELIQRPLEWYTLLNYFIKNKIVGLAYANIKKLGFLQYVPLQIHQLMKFYTTGNDTRNQKYQEELNHVLSAFRAKNIPCFPLKGAVLLSQLYSDSGSRSVNDIDLLIRLQDVEEITSVMLALDYVQGDYDYSTSQIRMNSREKEVSWKINMNTLPTFVKLDDSKEVEFFMVDFSYSLNLDKKLEPVEEMIQQGCKGLLLPEHFLVHLCCHLYKEATGAIWIYTDCDINMIKFCDIREYVLQQINEEQLIQAARFANRFGLQQPLYFTFFYLQMIYNDGYEQGIMNLLDITDKDFVLSPSSKHSEEHYQWKKTFWERLFAYSNREELGQQFRASYGEFSNF